MEVCVTAKLSFQKVYRRASIHLGCMKVLAFARIIIWSCEYERYIK